MGLCRERAFVGLFVAGPYRAGLRGERRPQEHRRLRVLSEVHKRGSQFETQASVWGCLSPHFRAWTSKTPRCSRVPSARSPALPSAATYTLAARRRSWLVPPARAQDTHSAIASRSSTIPVNRCLHVEQHI